MRLLHGSCEPRLETTDTPRHQRSITWVRRRWCWHIRRRGRRHLDCGALRRSLSRGERGTLCQDEVHLKSTQVGQHTHAGGLAPVGACVHLNCGAASVCTSNAADCSVAATLVRRWTADDSQSVSCNTCVGPPGPVEKKISSDIAQRRQQRHGPANTDPPRALLFILLQLHPSYGSLEEERPAAGLIVFRPTLGHNCAVQVFQDEAVFPGFLHRLLSFIVACSRAEGRR